MKIHTDHWLKPIPIRAFDWSAIDEDTYDGTGPIGYGETKQEAIDDLMQQVDE
jgi:hypothetical protein